MDEGSSLRVGVEILVGSLAVLLRVSFFVKDLIDESCARTRSPVLMVLERLVCEFFRGIR